MKHCLNVRKNRRCSASAATLVPLLRIAIFAGTGKLVFNPAVENTMRKPAETHSADRLNRIVEGTSIEGNIIADSNIRIDGKLKGTIRTNGRLVIGPSGSIEGEIHCENADIEGVFNGKIQVLQLLTLKSTARLEGDILTGKLAIEPGATFSGSCRMGDISRESRNTTEVTDQNDVLASQTA